MTDAFVLYDQASMQIKSIVWNSVETDSDIICFPIEQEMAINFLSGKLRLQDYSVSLENDKPVLLKKVFGKISNVSFWNLKPIEDEKENFKFTFADNIIEIRSQVPIDSYILYGSLKNDPSWLLYTWHLSSTEQENYMKLSVENAPNYSYFLRRIK